MLRAVHQMNDLFSILRLLSKADEHEEPLAVHELQVACIEDEGSDVSKLLLQPSPNHLDVRYVQFTHEPEGASLAAGFQPEELHGLIIGSGSLDRGLNTGPPGGGPSAPVKTGRRAGLRTRAGPREFARAAPRSQSPRERQAWPASYWTVHRSGKAPGSRGGTESSSPYSFSGARPASFRTNRAGGPAAQSQLGRAR